MSHITEAKLDRFGGLRQLRVTLTHGDGVRHVFLPAENLTRADEFAENARSFAQEIAPRRGRPRKNRVRVEHVGGDA